jgi:hypothetical protein
MLFDGLKNGMWVQLDVAHHLREHVPLNLSERQENVFIGEQCMLTSARFFAASVDDALSRFANLARRDIEVVYVHRILHLATDGQQDVRH